jgi:ABC-type proline/glycine betaine transport system ATPase subunit
VIHRKAGGYSLGMRQRLGLAAAMLGDPQALLLDEPFNGLDPAGIVWMRRYLRALAAEGRAVLVSSHLMSELQDTADHLVVVGRGAVIADTSVAALIAAASGDRIQLRTTAPDRVKSLLSASGVTVTVTATVPDMLTILSCRWGYGAGQAGAGRAQSRCQQARNASFHGQSGLIFRTRPRACRASRAGMRQKVAERFRVGVPQVRVVAEAEKAVPCGQVGRNVRGEHRCTVQVFPDLAAGDADASRFRACCRCLWSAASSYLFAASMRRASSRSCTRQLWTHAWLRLCANSGTSGRA